MAKKIVIATTKGQHQTLELKHNVAQEEIDELVVALKTIEQDTTLSLPNKMLQLHSLSVMFHRDPNKAWRQEILEFANQRREDLIPHSRLLAGLGIAIATHHGSMKKVGLDLMIEAMLDEAKTGPSVNDQLQHHILNPEASASKGMKQFALDYMRHHESRTDLTKSSVQPSR